MTMPSTVEQATFGEDFLPEPVPGGKPDWRSYKYTGERVKAGHPEVYAAIIEDLGMGTPYRKIMRKYGLTYRTIVAIEQGNAGTVEKIREMAAKRFHEITSIALERLAETLADPDADIDAFDLSRIADKSAEKAELLTGHATARVENIAPIPADDDLMMSNYHARYAKPIDAEVVPPGAPGTSPALLDHPAPPAFNFSDDRKAQPQPVTVTGTEEETETP